MLIGPHLVPHTSLCSPGVTYRTLCHALGHQVLPSQPFLGKQRISLRVASVLRVASTHILSLLATSLINNSRLIFICVINTNLFNCGEEISKLTVYREKLLFIKNYYSFQSTANLSIFQFFFLETAPSKNTSQKIAPSKYTFQKNSLKNCSLKKYISNNFLKNIAPSQKYISKKTFFNLLRENFLSRSKKVSYTFPLRCKVF